MVKRTWHVGKAFEDQYEGCTITIWKVPLFTRFSSKAEMAEHIRHTDGGSWPDEITRTQRPRLAPTGRSLLR